MNLIQMTIISTYCGQESLRRNSESSLCNQQKSLKFSTWRYNNFRYALDTILMAENEEELKNLLIRMKEE